MHFFYRTKKEGYIVCSQCAGRTGLPPGPTELGPRDHLEYVGVVGLPDRPFRCTECQVYFVVARGMMLKEVA